MAGENKKTKKSKESYTQSEAAAVMGVSTRTVQRWIEYGWLEAERHGMRVVRVLARSVEEICKQKNLPIKA